MFTSYFNVAAAQLIPASLKEWTAYAGPRTQIASLWVAESRDQGEYSPVYTLKGYAHANGPYMRQACAR